MSGAENPRSWLRIFRSCFCLTFHAKSHKLLSPASQQDTKEYRKMCARKVCCSSLGTRKISGTCCACLAHSCMLVAVPSSCAPSPPLRCFGHFQCCIALVGHYRVPKSQGYLSESFPGVKKGDKGRGEVRERPRGVETQGGGGGTYRKTPPPKRLWTLPPTTRFPPLLATLCHSLKGKRH